MADGKYPPHPLVAELAKGLKRKPDGTLSASGGKLDQAQQDLKQAAVAQQSTATEQQAVDAAATALADEIAVDPNIPELYLFAGFLGGTLDDSTGSTRSLWRLLYLDPKLWTWLLVDQKSIVARKQVEDETSPFGSRDHVWMKSDASVSQGEGALQGKNEIQARFMRGAFVSAGEFAASVSSGTFASVTGPACPLTPGCCGIRTR